MEGLGGMQYQGFAQVNASGNVAAQGRLIAGAYVEISGNALVAANGFKFGEEWTTSGAGSETWTDVPAESTVWTEQNTGTDQWQQG